MTGTPLPEARGFTDFQTVDLDAAGDLVDPLTGEAVAARHVPDVLERALSVPPRATDIFVFVHGWNNSPERAAASAARLFYGIEATYRGHSALYPELSGFRGHYIAVRWPSTSSPLPGGYRRIRDRAHAMTTDGHAASVLASLLGYVNAHRRPPWRGPNRLRNRDGQFLHCVGHSFGGRFLGEAVKEAASPRVPARLGWPWKSTQFPYMIDTLLVFQMAARLDVFATSFESLLSAAPINGPITLTFSPADRATRLWHRLIERTPAIGAAGASAPPDQIARVQLKTVDEPYTRADVPLRILNVDASRYYRHGRWRPEGAHSDFWYAESVHLLLSLAGLAR